MPTLYASFSDPARAEHAAGALFDHGIGAEHLSILVGEGTTYTRSFPLEHAAEKGISTTTANDAGMGAIKGLVFGSGVGAIAALAAMFVPGVGLVLGGGALAMAMAGGAGTIAAGGIAGGVAGYLRDQGVDQDVAATYSENLETGGAILAVATFGKTDVSEMAEAVLVKYGATSISTHYSEQTATPAVPVEIPEGTVREPSGIAYESPMVMIDDSPLIVSDTPRDVVLDRAYVGDDIAETDIVEHPEPVLASEVDMDPLVLKHPVPSAYADRPANDPLE